METTDSDSYVRFKTVSSAMKEMNEDSEEYLRLDSERIFAWLVMSEQEKAIEWKKYITRNLDAMRRKIINEEIKNIPS